MSAVVWVLKLNVEDIIKPKRQIGNFKTIALIHPQLRAAYKPFFIFATAFFLQTSQWITMALTFTFSL